MDSLLSDLTWSLAVTVSADGNDNTNLLTALLPKRGAPTIDSNIGINPKNACL
jgi:hypothetical protein